jgi:hypothetical protein
MKMGASTPLLLAALRAPGCMIAGAERAAGRRFEQVIDGEGKFRLERADTGAVLAAAGAGVLATLIALGIF